MTRTTISLVARRALVALAAFAALAAAPAPTSYDGHHVHLLVPAGWAPVPAAAAAARKSMAARPDLTTDAMAWGDASAGVTGLLISIDMKVDGPKIAVRPTVAAFVDGVFKPLPPGKRTDGESATALRARVDAAKGAVELSTLATGVIDKVGVLHGYSLTWKDSELRRLEKK